MRQSSNLASFFVFVLVCFSFLFPPKGIVLVLFCVHLYSVVWYSMGNNFRIILLCVFVLLYSTFPMGYGMTATVLLSVIHVPHNR